MLDLNDALALVVSTVVAIIAAIGVIFQAWQLAGERKARRDADQQHQQIVDNQLAVMRANLDRFAEEDLNRHINYLVPVCFIIINAIAKSRFYYMFFRKRLPPDGRDALSATRSIITLVQSDYRLVDDQFRMLFNDHQHSVQTTAILLDAHKFVNDSIIYMDLTKEHQNVTDVFPELAAIALNMFEGLVALRQDIIDLIKSEEAFDNLLFGQYERHGLNRRGEWLSDTDRMEIASPGATGRRQSIRDWLEKGLPSPRPRSGPV